MPVDFPGAKAKKLPPRKGGKESPLGFLEKLHFIDSYQAGPAEYVLLVRKAEKTDDIIDYLGWVDQREQLVPRAQIWHQSSMPWLAQLASIPAYAAGLNSPRVKIEG